MISDAMEPGRSGSQVLEVLLKTPSSTVAGYDSIKVQETIATAAWYIWWLRRRQTHGELVPPVNVCSNSIRSIVANAARTKTQGSVHKKMWIKPRAGFLKLNVDASFSAESHSGATGAIIRDGRGDFIAASSTFLPHVGSAQMAEAIAMLQGLRLANDKGCNNIEAESDSLEVIQLCSGEERIWNEATAVYADILNQASMIGNVEFTHCGRDINSVAHEIARECSVSQISCNWVDEPPSFLLQTLLDDVTIL
jgi:ribonuclease HI